VLVGDGGMDAVILQNKAIESHFETREVSRYVYSESGATFNHGSPVKLAQKGFDGLVWASTNPLYDGGAVYGNAGAHGGDMSKSLVMAEILHREKGLLSMNAEQMEYSYRSSILKRSPGLL
jgi:UDP-N-acetylmuramate dehydrogenase